MSWCGQCYASLLPEPTPTPTPTPTPEPEPHPHPVPVSVPVDATTPDTDSDAVAARLLAELAATREPQAPWLAALPSTPGAKAGLMVGGVVLGSVLLLALMTLLGLFL